MLGKTYRYNSKDADVGFRLASAFNYAGLQFTRMMFHQDRFPGS